MLAPAEQMLRPLDQPRRAEIVVAVQSERGADPGEAARTGHRVGRQLEVAYPRRPAVVLLLSDGAAAPAPAAPADPGAPPPPVPLLTWPHQGQSALEGALRAAEAFQAQACALVSAEGEEGPGEGARHLLAPILEDGQDLVLPCYATHRYEGVLSAGIVTPLTRALFGQRLRQPLGSELAVSGRLVGHLLGEAWHADPAHAGERLWLLDAALVQGCALCQSHLGQRPPRVEAGPDLAAALAQVVGLAFHQMRLHAATWQRVKGSRPVKSYGQPGPAPGDPRAPQLAPMLAAFRLGYQELGRLWGAVLPPQSLLALKRLAQAPEEGFALEDALWARVVYDFAVGYHLASMDRALLLRSMTPLYLGWAAGFVREVRDLDAEGLEARLERLGRAFEAAKPYLISRWRWPDRFNP